MSNENKGQKTKKTRQRHRPQHRWSKEQTVSLLETVLDKLKNEHQNFEKPTASIFYSQLFEEYCLGDLEDLGILAVKNKMRNLKDVFLKAMKWKKESGASLMECGEDHNIEENIAKICPHFALLEKIFDHQTSFNDRFDYDSGNTANTNETIEIVHDSEQQDENIEDTDQNNPLAESIMSDKSNDNQSETQTLCKEYIDKLKRTTQNRHSGSSTKRSVDSFSEHLQMSPESRRNQMEIRLERQYVIEQEQLELKKLKIELNESQFQQRIALEQQRLQIKKHKLEIKEKEMVRQNQIECEKLQLARQKN